MRSYNQVPYSSDSFILMCFCGNLWSQQKFTEGNWYSRVIVSYTDCTAVIQETKQTL